MFMSYSCGRFCVIQKPEGYVKKYIPLTLGVAMLIWCLNLIKLTGLIGYWCVLQGHFVVIHVFLLARKLVCLVWTAFVAGCFSFRLQVVTTPVTKGV